jgi:hypothetical protein
MSDDFFGDYDNDKPIAKKDNSNNENQSFSEELFSKKIEAEKRTFFIDLKQSVYGKFLKISERSRGKRNTIMIDEKNVDTFIKYLEEAKQAME